MLGSAHPGAFAFAQSLENLLSLMRAELSTKNGGKAAARHKERTASSLLSPTALADAEARAAAAEAELLAMLELEEAGVVSESKGKAKGKATGNATGKAKGHGNK